MADIEALGQLAHAYGIDPFWYDIWGGRHDVTHETLRALLGAMHVPAATDEQVRGSLSARHARVWAESVPSVQVVRASEQPLRLTLRLPAALDAQALHWRLDEEQGPRHEGICEPHQLEEIERTQIDGETRVARRLILDLHPAPGYHRFSLGAGDKQLGQTLLAVAPPACYLPPAVRGGGRVFGPTAQLYTLRSRRNWGMGDFADLRTVVEQWGQHGAAVVGLNPLHALFPDAPERASPYSPSSRLFLNVLYLDPQQIEEFHESGEAQRLVASAAFQTRLEGLRSTDLVDYPAVAAAKMQVLELLYATFRNGHVATGSPRAHEWQAFCAREGEQLRRHALFEALQEHFHRTDPEVWGWQRWPEPYRDPAAPAVAQFRRDHLERVEFYEWLQWQCDRQLHGVGVRAHELGLGVGLYGDLAVSIDRGGAEAWANQDLYALAAGVGAPPDDYSPSGQNWGLPPAIPERLRTTGYAPFIATLRASMRHAGALRVDHVMGQMRLYWIPEGMPNAQGAYVHYPMHDLLGILALESVRNQCMVIGEDLGTVPDEMRHAMYEYGVLSYRLLVFERRHGGDFKAPGEYPATALVAATTHDLPTLAGFWTGRDLHMRRELGMYPSDEAYHHQVLERAQDRARLLLAMQHEGLLPAGGSLDPAAPPDLTPELLRAVHGFLARTPCKVMMVQLEDALGVTDQVNVPGTIDQYPNWRRKLPLELEPWSSDARFAPLCAAIAAERAAAGDLHTLPAAPNG